MAEVRYCYLASAGDDSLNPKKARCFIKKQRAFCCLHYLPSLEIKKGDRE